MEGRQGTGMSAARRLDITGEALLTRPRAMEQEGGQVLGVVSWPEVAVSLLLVGPQALEGVRGVDGVEAWVVHGGVMRGAQTPGVHAGPPTRRGREARVVDARWDQ